MDDLKIACAGAERFIMKKENTRQILEDTFSNKVLAQKEKNLKLNDRSIKALQSNFLIPDAGNPKLSKKVDVVSYNFPGCKGQSCQGLRLLHIKKKRVEKKQLVLDYWLNTPGQLQRTIRRQTKTGIKEIPIYGKSKKHILGNYDPEHFNVRHIEKRVSLLREEYGNPDNLTWDQDINEGEKLKKVERFKQQHTKITEKIIKELIVEFYKAGFPKIKNDGTSPNRKTIRKQSLLLIGHNDRAKAFKLDEDKSRSGVMLMKEGYKDWDDVFVKHPSTFDPDKWEEEEIGKQGVSVYDSPLSVFSIHELKTDICKKYLEAVGTTVHVKLELKLALSYLWHFAFHKGYYNDQIINPLAIIKYAKPTQTHMTDWNKKEFTEDQLNQIYYACEDLKKQYPGQPELFQLALITGRRIETILNFQWSQITFKKKTDSYITSAGEKKTVITYGRINIPSYSNKTNTVDSIPITPTIKVVLDSLIEVRDKLQPWRRFIDWCFVSPRVKEKDFLRKGNEDNSAKARLKDPRYCWNALLEKVGLEGQAMQKMFRTTYQNRVSRLSEIHSSWDSITITGQTDTRAHEGNYLNKAHTPKVLYLFDQVDKGFNKAFKNRKTN